ncbi:unnamed protein product [Tilletia laevis]|uniref:Mitochondrial Rho GTPase 1 n=2 Tax=Tilletia TaxID=13289 RepID=A0A177V2G4_9BASI|nr:hypothetical protein CF336_g6192 [Tilletia laevis]KAE8255795.1 hypothetical protein A4X03_0g5510 [Tilletia caries]KAE8193769.1 hypothetical protein CF335_g5505 [Tilletia laevis]CAD6884950.1 unnamed protein product [Tilletia caries]CAD6899642.1 unnamed protein product [Tilletia laevis]
MRRELRVVLVGDSGVGKSTIITSLVKESYAPRVQRVVPELTLPPSVSPDGVTIKIIDTAAVATASASASSAEANSSPAAASNSTIYPASPTPSASHPRASTPADQQRAHLEAEIRRASVICLVYSIATPSSFERIPTFWLPYIRSILAPPPSNNIQRNHPQHGTAPNGYFHHNGNGSGHHHHHNENDDEDDRMASNAATCPIPIILVGNKIDLRSSDPTLSSDPSELTQAALEQELAPVMAEFREVETCIEASAFLHVNISEIFYFAQKAVLYPTAPLYDSREQRLRSRCVDALRRIFLLCDNDQDGVLNDRELDNFQRRCFDAPLHPQELDGVKELVLAAPVGGYANYASYESGYGSSNASASAAGGVGSRNGSHHHNHHQQQQPRRSGGASAAGSRHAPEGRSSVSGSSATASSATAMGNGRRYRAHPSRADSFTSNDTVSNTRSSRRQRTISASSSTSAAASASHPHPHIRNGGLTLPGFLYLHTIFIQRGRLETTWTVLRSFGYACPSLLLERSYVHPPFQIPPEHAVELSPHGYQFLTDVFEAHDKDRDGALSEPELDNLFVIAPGGEHPWARRHGADFPEETTTTDQNGRITLQGWLAQWSMTTLLEPGTTLAYMAYLGYPSYGVGVTGPGTPPAVGASSSSSSSKSGGIRSYFSGNSGKGAESGSASSPLAPGAGGAGGGFWSSGNGSSAQSRRNVKPRPTGPPPTTTALKVVKIPRKAERERFLRRGFGMSVSSSSSAPRNGGTTGKAGNSKKKGPPARSVLLGYVFGAAGSGKTALLRAMVGREFDPLPSTGRHGGAGDGGDGTGSEVKERERERNALSTHSVVSAVEYAGAEKYLVLQEFEAAQEVEVLKSPKRLAAADVAVFVYDATDPASFAYLVNLREAHPQLGGLPSLFVATKADLLYPSMSSSGMLSGMMSPVGGVSGGRMYAAAGATGSPESVLGSSPPRELYRVRSPPTPSPGFGSSDLTSLSRRKTPKKKERRNEDSDDSHSDSDSDGDGSSDDDATIHADPHPVDPRTYCASLGLSIPALHNDAGPLELSVRAGRLADVYSVLCAIALEPTGAIPDAAAWDREMSRRRREGSWFGWFFGSASASAAGGSGQSTRGKKMGRRAEDGKAGGGRGKRKELVRWQTGARARWVLFVVLVVGGAAISFRLWWAATGPGGGGSGGRSSGHHHQRPGEAGLGLWRSVLLGGGSGGSAGSGGQAGEGGFHGWVRWARTAIVGAEAPVQHEQ